MSRFEKLLLTILTAILAMIMLSVALQLTKGNRCNCHLYMTKSEETVEEAPDLSGTVIIEEKEEVAEEEPVNVDEEEEDIDPLSWSRDRLTRDRITLYSDIAVPNCPSVEELDALIDWWEPRILNGEGTTFKGQGWAFYKAWEETGIDPLVILGIAAWESGWGNSPIAMDKHNYFGIAAYDHDPYNCAKDMGDSVGEGIINGAIWIKEHYYDKGYTTMYDINMNGYNLSMEWSDNIVHSMINRHYQIMTTHITKEDKEL